MQINHENNQSRQSSRYQARNRNNTHSNSFKGELLQIEHQIRSLEDEIQFTICNYESILQIEKKNTAQRNQFLLYLIQTMKQKHNQELVKYQAEYQAILQQKDQANGLESQMKHIGEGVDSILEEGKKLKDTNFLLLKELNEQNLKQKQLDQEIQSHLKDIEDLRAQVDECEIKKIKWGRKKKNMIQLIDETQNTVKKGSRTCKQASIEEENIPHFNGNADGAKFLNKTQESSK